MNRDEEIRIGLRNAGVPETVLSTTLLKEQAPTLREMVADKKLIRQRSTSGLFMFPKKRDDASHARKLFYLFAKELFLSGTTVYCIPLSRLLTAITTDDMEGDAVMVEQVRMVFVLDFYEEGAQCPLDAAAAAKLRTWVRAKFEQGGAVSFLSDGPAERCSAWWPASFLGFINDNVVTHAVVR